MSRLLAEEEEKMKALMGLQEEQEEYILKTQREKQELKQEMEAKSRDLEEAQRQLEEVRANRHRVDQDVVVRAKTVKTISQLDMKTFYKFYTLLMASLIQSGGASAVHPPILKLSICFVSDVKDSYYRYLDKS